MKTVKIRVYGKVQNVNMRAMIYQEALKLEIKGYVQNDPNSIMIVNAVFQSDDNKINQMLDFIKSNPRRSKVEDIMIEKIKAPKFQGFNIKYH